tara:strand:+ start:14851 stop:15861 length:1011 start_codon:yes stop_codon:yes gene_type:complete
MNPLEIAWVMLKNDRGDVLERVLNLIESPANRDISDEELASEWERLLLGVGQAYNVSPHDVDRTLGTHFITDEGSEPDHELGHTELDSLKPQLEELLHDMLDTGLHFNAPQRRGAVTTSAPAYQNPPTATARPAERPEHDLGNPAANAAVARDRGLPYDEYDPGWMPPICEECDDADDTMYGGRDPDTGEPLYVCAYSGHDDYNYEHLYDDYGYLWMDGEGYLTTPLTPPDPAEYDSHDNSERGDPRPMTNRAALRALGVRPAPGEEIRPDARQTVPGLPIPLTAASQGEGRVGPDVMDERELMRYEAPQLREMIRRIGEELTRRGYGDRYQGVTE